MKKKLFWSRTVKRWKNTLEDRRKKLVLILIPAVAALIVYMVHYKGDIFYSLYGAIRVYVAGCSIDQEDITKMWEDCGTDPFRRCLVILFRICMEIARWGGLAVTGTFFFGIVRDYLARRRIAREIERKQVIAVHGSDYYKRLLGETFGDDAVTPDFPEKFAARRHVLAFDRDSELLDYLNKNLVKFPHAAGRNENEKRMFLCLLSSSHTKYSSEGFIVNNIAENCARLYWEEHFVRQFGSRPETRIVIIGFDDYGQAILSQALLVNVFLKNRPPMEYHVFGSSSHFFSLHRGIEHFVAINEKSETQDSVFFHEDSWEDNIALINSADRLILTGDLDEDNICILGWIQEHSMHADIHVRIHDERIVQALYPQTGIKNEKEQKGPQVLVFGSDRALYTREVILEEALLQSAKKIHARYMRRTKAECQCCGRCGSACDFSACIKDCGLFARDWNRMSLFLQRSNVYAADHMDVKVRQVIGEDCSVTPDSLRKYRAALGQIVAKGETGPYMELEHRRWLRYHYFWGWSYAQTTNRQEKQHRLIIPFEELEPQDRDKNIDAYEEIADVNAFGDPA